MTAPPIRPPLPAPFPTAVDKCSTGTVIVQLTRARVLESLPGPMTRGRPSPVCAPIWSRWCPPSGEESSCGLGVLGASRYRYAIMAVRGAMR